MGDPNVGQVDLDSLVTHEAGHLLGLAHTPDASATMFAGYRRGTIDLRSLEADDIAGLCAIYPPTRVASSSSCEPRHGYADRCGADQPAMNPPPDDVSSESGGCSMAAGSNPPFAPALGIAALAWLLRRRR